MKKEHKLKAKVLSNLAKVGIVLYLFFEYHFQSIQLASPLTADNCKGLLFIAIAGFLILLPVDGSIFIKNLFEAKNSIKKDNHNDKPKVYFGDDETPHISQNNEDY